jgi:hypothetical protein
MRCENQPHQKGVVELKLDRGAGGELKLRTSNCPSTVGAHATSGSSPMRGKAQARCGVKLSLTTRVWND